MPELPEVETIRRGLEKYLPGRKISGAEIRLPKLLINCNADEFSDAVSGCSFTAVRRVGKILILDCGALCIFVRLGMTGQLTFRNPETEDSNKFSISPLTGLQRAQGQFAPDKHTHIIMHNSDGTSLCYRDIRQFGRWYLYSAEEAAASPELKALGPDPFSPDYTLERLRTGLKKTRRAVKTALLDQSVVCGLGNIYVDEVLFASGIRPDRPASSLSDDETEAVFSNIVPILQSSIDNRGTTFSDYRDADGSKGDNAASLKAYGRYGRPCTVCGGEMLRMSVGGRTSTWCPVCQH